MKCKESSKLFAAYLDNEVTESERETMQAHLAACPDCRKEAESLSETRAKFKQTLAMATNNAEPSAEAWANLRQQILNERYKVTASVLPARENWWERVGRVSLIPRRLTWKTVVAGILAVVIVASAVIAVPALTGHDEKVSAAEIALASPEVQAALGGNTPAGVGVADNIDSNGLSRVVLTLPPDTAVIADVNIKNHVVTQVITQTSTDATLQLAIDIAMTDPRVQNLVKLGNKFYGGGAIEFTASKFQGYAQTLPPGISVEEMFKYMGIDNMQDLIGFTAMLPLKLNDDPIVIKNSTFISGDPGYYVWVNLSTDKVVGLGESPLKQMTFSETTVVKTEYRPLPSNNP